MNRTERIKFDKGFDYELAKIEDQRKTALREASSGKIIFNDGINRKDYIDFNNPNSNAYEPYVKINEKYDAEIEALKKKYNREEDKKAIDFLVTIEDIYKIRPGLKDLHDKVFPSDKDKEKKDKAINNEIEDYNKKAQLVIKYLDGEITDREVMEANLKGKYTDKEAKHYADELVKELRPILYDRFKGKFVEEDNVLEKEEKGKDKIIEQEENRVENKEEKSVVLEAREKLDKIRENYSKELKKCLDEMDRQKSIDKVRSSTFNILAGVKNLFSKEKMNKVSSKDYKEEDFYTEEYKKLEQEYKQAKIDLRDALIKEKTEELIKAGFMDEKLELALKRFKATDVFNEVVYDERLKMIEQRARANKNILTKTWNTYKEMPRYKKVLVGTLIFIPLTTAGGVGAVLGAKGLIGLGGFVGLKFGVGMGVGAFTSMASAKTFDLFYKNKNIEFYKKVKEENENINDQFIKGEIFEDEYEEEKKLLENKKNKYLKNQTIVKTATSIGLGLTAGLLSGGIMNSGVNHAENLISNVDSNSVDTLSHTANSLDSQIGDVASVVSVENVNVEVVAHDGQGVINTFHDLQNNLKAEYPDVNSAPESVKHILSTSDTDLAKEYGVYRPGEEAESAKIFVGDKLIFNKETGEIVFKHIRGGEHILQKGVKYLGEMFDVSRKL